MKAAATPFCILGGTFASLVIDKASTQKKSQHHLIKKYITSRGACINLVIYFMMLGLNDKNYDNKVENI